MSVGRRPARLVALGLLLAASLVQAQAPADDPADDALPATEAADDEAAPAPAAPRFDAGLSVLEAGANGAYRLELAAPDPARALLERHLDLARFRDQPDIAPVEVGRLLAATPAQVRRLLEPEGHFNPVVEVERRDDPAGGPPTLRVRVDPGPQARVGRLQLEMQGSFGEAMAAGDEELARRWQRMQARWPLQAGAPFSQAAWGAAKNRLLAGLRNRGYPGAAFLGTGAEVDPASDTVRLFLVVDSGPLYRVGAVRVEGLARTPASAATNLRPFGLGEPFTEKMLLDYQEVLQKSGLYDGVAVELELDPERADRAVVVTRLREQKLQTATVSVGFSSNTGPRVGLEHTHRRLFGYDLVGSSRLRLGRSERELAFDLLTYPQERGYRNLVALKADDLDAGGARTQTQRLRVGRTRDTETLDRLYYLEFNRTALDTSSARSIDRALLANYEWAWRDVNSVVFPTRGVILNAQGGAGYAVDGGGDRGSFGRVLLQFIGYQPLARGWFAQVRGQVGQVIKADSLGVPDSLLFRAGGDDSVRGYGYRTLGPVRDGSVVGGPVLATGTAELMHRFSDRWRAWYGAVFVDAGNAAERWEDFKPVYGYGVGVRWRSPIGPLRVDLAYGEAESSLRLHVSVGVSF